MGRVLFGVNTFCRYVYIINDIFINYNPVGMRRGACHA